MIHNKFRYLLTLVALFAISTGAWAQATVVTWNSINGGTQYTQDGVTFTCSDYDDEYEYFSGPGTFTTNLGNFTKIEITAYSMGISGEGWSGDENHKTWTGNAASVPFNSDIMVNWSAVTFKFTIEPPLEVTWDKTTKTGTFSMPGSDVVLTPIYAKAAAFATTGEEPNVKTLAPTAAEGVIAGTTDPIIIEGTVAAGQGTVMYAVTTTNTTAPALSAFSSELPTAANIADDGATVYVWYYIKGTDTPDGQEATAENTFNDSEICAQPLEVIVLSNKFDITFNAANANTIEAGKATVKVGDADATVTEGKLQGVKMGTKVTINAKQGYKFRKVEAKKKAGAAATALSPALENGATVVINYVFNNYPPTVFTFTNNNGTYSCNITGQEASNFTGSLTLNGSTLTFSAVTSRKPDNINLTIDFDTASDTYSFTKKGSYYNSYTISVNGTDITSQLTEEK